MTEVISELKEQQEEENLTSLIDHIFGYKKIRDFTLQFC